MNFKVIAIIILLSLCFFFGFKTISSYRNETSTQNLGELKILKYLPRDNKLLFISNSQSSDIGNSFERNFNSKNIDGIILIKNSILSYLGIDIGDNKLEDLYNNELTISTYNNNKREKDDILIVLKIKPEKNINDLLNLSNPIDQNDEIIKIYRENKLNYLNYIYKTNDDYIIASSNKKLILDSIEASNNWPETKNNFSAEILRNFKNENNILFTTKLKNNLFLNNENNIQANEDIIATTLALKNKRIIIKTYVINNKKNLDIFSYKNLINQNEINYDNYKISIYSDLNSSIKYLSPLINNFEKRLLEELNQYLTQNILLLNSNQDWIVVLENNHQKSSFIDDIKQLKDFNKYSLEKNEYIYSVYTKDILEEEEEIIKQFTYKDLFTIESDKLFIISNNLIKDGNINSISEKFFEINNKKDANDFIYKKLDVKGLDSKNTKNLSSLKNLNFMFNNIINFSTSEFKEISKQSIPERNPIIYSEHKIEIFQ